MKLKNNPKLEVLILQDKQYKKATFVINFSGHRIAQINQEQGMDNLEVEIFTEFEDPNFKIKMLLADFFEALEIGKKQLQAHTPS